MIALTKNNDSTYELPKGRRVDVITAPERRRRWAAAEKKAMVDETYEPGHKFPYVAQKEVIAPDKHLKRLFGQVTEANEVLKDAVFAITLWLRNLVPSFFLRK